jgi:hypothetical protein
MRKEGGDGNLYSSEGRESSSCWNDAMSAMMKKLYNHAMGVPVRPEAMAF